MHRYRSHTCGALRESDIGSTVRLSGWCHRIRDHGGVLFIDLRDHYGLTQVVADPDSKAFKLADTDDMLAHASAAIDDFAGGTQLGESLKTLRQHQVMLPAPAGVAA